MGRPIIKIKEKYFIWSTVVDAPVTYGMTREELEDYYQAEYGRQGMYDFEDRMKDVEKKGVSEAYFNKSVKDLIKGNRAGPNETKLTLDQIYEQYN